MLFRAHWHGEIVVRMIQPDTKKSQVEFLNHFRTQVYSMNIILSMIISFFSRYLVYAKFDMNI